LRSYFSPDGDVPANFFAEARPKAEPELTHYEFSWKYVRIFAYIVHQIILGVFGFSAEKFNPVPLKEQIDSF